MPQFSYHKVWAEINCDALKYNYKLLCDMIPNAERICVVKADAYGHISSVCVKALLEAGSTFFAVSCIEEALAVRKICESCQNPSRILILGYTDVSQADILAGNDIIQTILSKEYASELNAAAANKNCIVKTHISIDTGMNRVGICAQSSKECASAADDISEIVTYPSLSVEGMFTHFARADEDYETVSADDSHVRKQFSRFNIIRNLLLDKGIKLFCHACNSAAAVRFPEYALDGVRIGILLYGARPSGFVNVQVKPVMSLKTVIVHTHNLNVGETVSYGGHYSSNEERTIATLPIGYADGFLRAYSGHMVTVHTPKGNFKAPVVGNVCMDQCMIDITDIPATAGNTVTLFGNDPEDLSRLAKMAGSIEYEVLCLISARVPRVVKES